MKTDEPSDILVLDTESNGHGALGAECPSGVDGDEDRLVGAELLVPLNADRSQDLAPAESIENADYAAMSLDELGQAIVILDKENNNIAGIIKHAAACSFRKAVSLGNALLAAKKMVPHGQWTAWLKLHVSELSEDRACRYMKLAREIPHMRNLDENVTLRRAFLLAGVVKEPLKGDAKRDCKPPMEADAVFAPSDVVSRFRSLRGFLDAATPRLCAMVLPDSEADELSAEVELIVGHLRNILRHLGKMPALLPEQPRAFLALPAPSASLPSPESPALPPSSPTLPITPPAPPTAPPTPPLPTRSRPPRLKTTKKQKEKARVARAAKAARTAKAVRAGRESHAAFLAKGAAAARAAKQNTPTATDRAVEGTSKRATK